MGSSPISGTIFFILNWELAYVIYNIEHNIFFKRNFQSFEYEFNGKKYNFYPDFQIENNKFVEIKGWMGEKNKAKIASIPNLIIITKKEIQPYLKYVISKYGKNFHNLYE